MIRRSPSRSTSHERWLVSYADFITLLFAFFVVLYASAQIDRTRVGRLSAAIQTAFQDLGAFSPAPSAARAHQSASPAGPSRATESEDVPAALQAEIERELAKELEAKEIAVRSAPDGLVISLREMGFFESGSAQLKPEAQKAFAKIARIILQRPYRLRIEGHTDNLPIHNNRFNSNWELSTGRATEVVRLLLTEYGFAPDRLAAAGYGEFHPIANNASSDGRATNRRVDIVILSESKHP